MPSDNNSTAQQQQQSLTVSIIEHPSPYNYWLMICINYPVNIAVCIMLILDHLMLLLGCTEGTSDKHVGSQSGCPLYCPCGR